MQLTPPVALVKAGAADNGGQGDAKALNYANLVKLTDTTGTMLALPAGLSAMQKPVSPWVL